MREASTTLKRRSVGKPDKVWLESGLYPNYYLNSWHYQTDGWLSDESAKVYESSTETVFIGKLPFHQPSLYSFFGKSKTVFCL